MKRSYDKYTPEQRKEYMRNYYAKRLAEAKAILGGSCTSCGTDEDLEFDHVDPNDKYKPITKILMGARATWLAELKRCQLLCVPCHKAKTQEHIAQGVIITGRPYKR